MNCSLNIFSGRKVEFELESYVIFNERAFIVRFRICRWGNQKIVDQNLKLHILMAGKTAQDAIRAITEGRSADV